MGARIIGLQPILHSAALSANIIPGGSCHRLISPPSSGRWPPAAVSQVPVDARRQAPQALGAPVQARSGHRQVARGGWAGLGHLERAGRQGYVYKKPKLVPGKADAEAQRGFLEKYKKLKENKSQEDPIYFMDATHPHHNPTLGYGWIRRGEEREIPSNTGRKRLNINGAIELERLEPVVRFDETIDSTSTIALFEQIEQANSQAQRIYVICDNAGYYRSHAVQHFLESSKIELIFLPSYSPNLNLIERFWKFFKKQVLHNKYYETFSTFRKACEQFFQNSQTYADQLRSLLTENFQIIGEKKPKFGIP